jgi:hypothetical protein
MDVAKVVAVAFGDPQKCYGHCEAKATLRFLRSGGAVIACFACPSGYVSKVMAYGTSPTRDNLKALLTEALKDGPMLADQDLRVATRHAWDLGLTDSDISASYWTQNYRRGKSDDPNRKALFACGRCGALYLQPVTATNTLCQRCLR